MKAIETLAGLSEPEPLFVLLIPPKQKARTGRNGDPREALTDGGDVARPLDLSPEDVAKRPDVLVIESGEIELPGNPEMKNIGLPDKVVYACLAETIVLALEGRFEVFTIGRDIEWEKVKIIYKLGLKHGMKLASISGVNGVFTDEDIAKVKALALEARNQKQSK